MPCPNAGAVFLHSILSLARGLEIPGIEALHPNEDSTAAGADRLIDKAGDRMGGDVRLDDELDRNAFVFAQSDESVEDLFPGRVSGEIVVGEEIQIDAGVPVCLSDCLRYALGGPVAALAPLDVDDGAERAVEGTATAAVDGAVVRMNVLCRELLVFNRTGRIGQIGKIVQEPIDRFELPVVRILEQVRPAMLHLAGYHTHARVHQFLDFRRHSRKHSQHAAYMKAADHYRDLFRSKSQGDVRCPAKLVGLHSHQADHNPLAGAAVEAEDPVQRRPVHGLIHHVNPQVYFAKRTPLPYILGQAVQASQA